MANQSDENTVWERFLLLENADVRARVFDPLLHRLPPRVLDAANAFKHNIEGAINTMSMPVMMAIASCNSRSFAVNTVASGFQLKESGKLAQMARADIIEEVAKLASEAARKDVHAEMVAQELNRFCKLPMVTNGAAELLRQGVVLLWSSVEVFARDAFVAILDTSPDMVGTILRSRDLCRLFDFERLRIEELEPFDFDIKGHLGEILLARKDLKSLPVIKTVFRSLFPMNAEMRNALDNPNLWSLFQQRHLIVHKRGVVDREYKDATKTQLKLGDELVVTASEISQFVPACFLFVVSILCAIHGVRACDAAEKTDGSRPSPPLNDSSIRDGGHPSHTRAN